MLAHPGRGSRLRLRQGWGGRRSLFQRQGQKTLGRGGGFFQGSGEICLRRSLWHLQAGTGLAGGLLGGNQGGTDLHSPNLTKQG